jgi:type VI secretion system secreted protein Hcp
MRTTKALAGVALALTALLTVTACGSTSTGGSGTEAAGSLVAQVCLNFARVDFEYRRQRPDGSLDEGVHFKWDLQQQRPGSV